jgi:DNA-binding transcriptional LysR family regulator
MIGRHVIFSLIYRFEHGGRRAACGRNAVGKNGTMILRHLQYLTALAREQHFARAAAACNVTQPTLSAGIKQLEESLGVLLVERGQRYVGMTPEGARALQWAQRVLADHDGLRQELSQMREGLAGLLRIGAIPVALPAIALLTGPFCARHGRTKILVTSQTSADIQRGLDEFGLDVGLTYLDNEPLARVRSVPLYQERFLFLCRDTGAWAARERMAWAEAAAVPMCLLTSDMQNRRILDLQFQRHGAEANAIVETNSLITLWSHVCAGTLATIVPQSFLLLVGSPPGLLRIPMVEAQTAYRIGLVASDRDPLPPVAHAMIELARGLDLQARVDRGAAPLASPA